MGIFQANTPPTDEPKHLFRPLSPRNPLSPALRSGPTTAPGASPKSKFLAAHPPGRARGKSLMKRGSEHQFHKSKSKFLAINK